MRIFASDFFSYCFYQWCIESILFLVSRLQSLEKKSDFERLLYCLNGILFFSFSKSNNLCVNFMKIFHTVEQVTCYKYLKVEIRIVHDDDNK